MSFELADFSLSSHSCESALTMMEVAFPPNEIRKRPKQLALIKEHQHRDGRYTFSTIEIGRKLMGLLGKWRFDEEIVFVEHLAIAAAFQGKGIGSQVMYMLQARSQGMVFEVEPPVNEAASRRISTWENAGFILNPNYIYIPPPYSGDQDPIRLILMTGKKISDCLEYSRVLKELYKRVYGVEL